MTAGNNWKCGTNRLDKTIFDIRKENQKKEQEAKAKAIEKEKEEKRKKV